MKRDPALTIQRPDPLREAVGLPVGQEGEFFVGEAGFRGQERGDDVVDGNRAPYTQPGLWCQWEPSGDGERLAWDGGEKFYKYEAWLAYIIDNFLSPWGYSLKGKVSWQGESDGDVGFICVYNNQIYVNQDPVLDKLVAEL
ncbi:MAG: hypothetical protein AB7L09_02675 [Nitrospira sp.]